MPSIHVETAKSPLYCLKCGTHCSKYAENKFLHHLIVECRKCGWSADEYGLGVKVLPTSGEFLRVGPTRDSYWYHSTHVEGWAEKYTEFSDPIYLGTRVAAIRRFKDLASDPKVRRPSGKGWLYKMKLKPKVKIHRSVLSDDHVNPSSAEFDDRVVRYVNLFESVGSISLITRPEHFNIIDVKELS